MTTMNQVVPNEFSNKEFLSQFKTEADENNFLKQFHAQVLGKMLEGEMDIFLGYEKTCRTLTRESRFINSDLCSREYKIFLYLGRQQCRTP